MKNSSAPITKYRKDYQPSNFLISETHLTFILNEQETLVKSRLLLRRNPKADLEAKSIQFDGENLTLQSILWNGEALSADEYKVTDEGLELTKVADEFELVTVCKILPQDNSSLEGLYKSGDKFCTQCEAEGFRKITYYLDRPDVLSRFYVRIEADKSRYPLLLSNGNPVASGDMDDNRHFVEWQDPFLKPCYLFALVAGDLDLLEDQFITKSGRTVKLQLYVDKGKLDQSDFAMQSLINAMKWDEQRFNLEYDLDLYMIVAVSDFNMGAMENKGLNIFNTKYVLANPQTATDQDFEGIESVIGHEYFHNWTGNRVTCRDWFQLSLKEGLTVFRDQVFTEDMRSKAVKRIDDVKVIRSHQFAEDAGPLAHPIRPDEYIEMNNFYTVTVYNKGAEIIRMIHTLLGEQAFQRGMALYFERHDGQAVTCDDFVSAMADASDIDLSQFKHWYSQAGTPQVSINYQYHKDEGRMTLIVKQSNQHPSSKQPFLIPLKLGLVGRSGKPQSFSLEKQDNKVTETLIHITDSSQVIELYKVDESSVPSLFRDFSAPVKFDVNYTHDDLAFLFAYDENTFTRWDAGQQLMEQCIVSGNDALMSNIAEAFKQILNDSTLDNAFKARALVIPDLKTLFESHSSKGVDFLIERRRSLKDFLAKSLEQDWLKQYQSLHQLSDKSLDQDSIARRSIKNLALSYLVCASDEHAELLKQQFSQAQLMTEEISALSIAAHEQVRPAQSMLDDFYKKWHQEPLVMDKWLSVQSTIDSDNVFEVIERLKQDPVFSLKNPNKVRSLYSAFAGLNFAQFHRKDGKGYRLIADTVFELDSINAQIAANLSKQFSGAAKLDKQRQKQVAAELKKIKNKPNLSKDVFEVVSKTLEQLVESGD
ncbi:aminopeptidase N [Pleionea mediterranea]|uniref:Aminopeptidase N n=1 Tax=Pleionea mediterranea TaxID=523701 RepID=A0A316FJW2_9GAMM|nr:aminopeptidase N [Pleionea mediterranea]PWK49198.1 aminopeptidase N [Pleionea mediterranea]